MWSLSFKIFYKLNTFSIFTKHLSCATALIEQFEVQKQNSKNFFLLLHNFTDKFVFAIDGSNFSKYLFFS